MKTELVGPLEQQILEILWKSGSPLKPAEVKANLKGKHAYTTIMTVLKRLSDKNILKRSLVGKVYLYYPRQSREEFVKANLSNIYGDFVKNYGKLAISQFVDCVKTSKEDLKLLTDYLVDKQK